MPPKKPKNKEAIGKVAAKKGANAPFTKPPKTKPEGFTQEEREEDYVCHNSRRRSSKIGAWQERRRM
jgi:hypothetical protein